MNTMCSCYLATLLILFYLYKSNQLDIVTFQNNYDNIYNAAAAECMSEGINVVLNRHDGMNIAYSSELRPWSFSPYSYVACDSKRQTLLSLCDSLVKLLNSSKLGQRVNCDGTYVFLPHECMYKWYSPSQACTVASQFSGIYFFGDSIMRQTLMSFNMILSGNYVHGASSLWLGDESQHKCKCDGQFAEALICRECQGEVCKDIGSEVEYSISDWRNICPTQPGGVGFLVRGKIAYLDLYQTRYPLELQLCFDDPRPRVVLFHFGLKMAMYEYKGVGTLKRFIETLNQERDACTYRYDFHIIWFSEEPELQAVYDKYHYQNEQTIADYNTAIYDYIMTLPRNQNVTFLNSTEIARHGAYSDGMHPLSETHAIRTMYILNMMEMISAASA